jgi:UPF0176 protein
MSTLHNRVSRKELKEKLATDTTPRNTLSFYCYFEIEDPTIFRNNWYVHLDSINVKGRIYIATEGINAQISCPVENYDKLKDFINSEPALKNLRLNKAIEESNTAFYVLDIKVRKKIVADGIEDPTFSMNNRGRYVNADEFNTMVKDSNTMVIDMRNHYEYEVGRIDSAIEIPSDTFREQLPMAVEMFNHEKDRNIIMYCTGGIRCEKASSWMLHNGFKNVFHLEGGIINYINQVKENNLENHFIGKNFVFDERLGERITEDIISNCHQCGKPCDTHVNCSNSGCHMLFIQCDDCNNSFNGSCSDDCKSITLMDIESQKKLRKGVDKGRNVFNKSKKNIELITRKNNKN